ncbi:hypothetical protein DBR06_SOUSAS1810069, partial [Sousa chinensis]
TNLQFQEPVTLEDVDVGFRYEEWKRLDPPRKAFYADGMLKNYGTVIAL